MPNKKSATKLSANILNYFAAFTETRFNFRTLINYRWTNDELTLDLSIFHNFQNELLKRIQNKDYTPFVVRDNEHTLILEYDVVEYFAKNPDTVTRHNFSQWVCSQKQGNRRCFI